MYWNLEGVDPWDEERDARLYAGPWPVVAHPPCERWGRYWGGGPSARVKRIKGDDAGCFAAALEAVRKWGGVLEHPEASHAWRAFGLPIPTRREGWITGNRLRPHDGWTCCVEQGHYGHRARKATWLYAFGCELPALGLGPGPRRTARRGIPLQGRERRRSRRRSTASPAPQHRGEPAYPAGLPRLAAVHRLISHPQAAHPSRVAAPTRTRRDRWDRYETSSQFTC